MDTQLEKTSFISKLLLNKKKLLSSLIGLLLFIFVVNSLATPTVARDLVRTSTVFRGELITQIEGSGVVKSTSLELHYSPIATYVKKMLLREGQLVAVGDTIVILDSSEIEKEIANLENQVLIDANTLRSKELDFAQLELLNDRNYKVSTANLKLHEYEYESAVKLHQIGGISESDLKVAQVAIERDKIELSFLEKEQALNEEKLKQEIRTLRLTIENKKKELHFQLDRLGQSIVRSKVNGAIISQKLEAGEKVAEGQLLTQISNLKSFVVETRFSQRYISNLQANMPATIRINDQDYKGIVTLVQLEIKDGFGFGEVKFTDDLPETIRQSQTAQVFVQTGVKENVLMVERGAFLNSSGLVAFVVQGDEASQQLIETGGRNHKYVEIISGLNDGDEIIVSRIDDYIDYNKFILN